MKSLRILSSIIAILICTAIYADNDIRILYEPNIVYGEGCSRNLNKAREEAFKDLAANLSTDVSSKIVTDSNGDVVKFSSSTVSTTNITIRNSKKIEYKENGKWHVYRYIDLDNPYSGYETKHIQQSQPAPVQNSSGMKRVTFVVGAPRRY